MTIENLVFSSESSSSVSQNIFDNYEQSNVVFYHITRITFYTGKQECLRWAEQFFSDPKKTENKETVAWKNKFVLRFARIPKIILITHRSRVLQKSLSVFFYFNPLIRSQICFCFQFFAPASLYSCIQN